jgi:hypothetical protein
MAEQQVLAVQEGLWIDKDWLDKAGLGSRLQILIEDGEIRIMAASVENAAATPEEHWSEESLQTFLSLGEEAVPGQLQDTSINHDRYLYGKAE